ncbi:spore photoproduct lyase [Friedmanniella endophytica]|uniref:Spore photoproduct lyase n=1 Tax=Microlunatus kandeliicorticis TaxID=1759536 RepID=A0A7W3P6L0_9ACTN|nr:radical SAM protein [Microlunatus kandeliicorticis]MBA8795030.1 spore photoproduct lyase [Microlunatus kandeliicorticis]
MSDHRPRHWSPRRVLVTRSAAEQPHATEILRRCEAAGVPEIVLLPGDRLTGLRGDTDRETYARAKSTLAVVVAPPSARRPQPIPPSADWRIDLARGCPAHCQYCYLAGSLTGPPVTRAYANLDEVLGEIPAKLGQGTVTSASPTRAHEGTTFELSCYTDPLGIEPLTGSLATAVARAGSGAWGNDVQLRFTTKYDDVSDLVGLDHGGRTRARFSVNAAPVAERFDGGTAPVAGRLAALRRLALAGYPVGLTIAPVMPVPDWQQAYGALLDDVGAAVEGVPGLDLTAEIITHRFTPGSRDVLLSWYPRTKLEMEARDRTAKRSKFGGIKYVYPREVMAGLRGWFTAELAARFPEVPLLYWT